MKSFLASLCLLAACVAIAAAPKRTKVACVGNSITFGYTLEDPKTESYPSQLQLLLGQGYEVGNFGKSGATLLNKGHRPYMQTEEFRQAMDFAGDIVVIHLGINDTDPRNWPNHRDSFVQDYLALIDSLRSVNAACRVFICRLTPLSDRHHRFESGTRDWHAQIQEAIEVVARRAEVRLVDLHEPLYSHHYVLHDAVHPDKEGAAIMARTVYSAITGDFGGLRMPMIFSDNMVLQRDRPLKIQGTANAGDVVTVSIGGQAHVAKTADDGLWSVTLLPLAAGPRYSLVVSTAERRLVYSNVLAGEVWLCSGQSNMEFYMRRCATAEQDIPNAACDDIRLFDMKENWRTDEIKWSPQALDSVNHLQYFKEAKWAVCTPQTVERFSAVAYYFGKMLQDSLKVPVGLVCNAVGGSPAEAWVSRRALEREFPAIMRGWPKNDFIQEWVRNRAIFNSQLSDRKLQRHPYEPAYLFECAVEPLRQFPIAGVIWYQGESNAHNVEAHEKLFPLLVGSWRDYWDDDALPFYFVQLSGINRPSWGWFRDSELRLLRSVEGVGMAVSSDLGHPTDVHPRDKKPVGERLARWALRDAYGHRWLTPSGPLFRSAVARDGAIFVQFDYGDGLRSSDGRPISTFEVAEEEGLYSEATAEVVGEGLLRVSSPAVRAPRFVRYAWKPYTPQSNLVNSDGLPASTFRAEVPMSPLALADVCLMRGFPVRDRGYAKGVSACFAGLAGGRLVMAGGCNFPGAEAKDGGAKRFYRDVYEARLGVDSVLAWRRVGELPRELAYGVSVSTAEGLVCIGGTDGNAASDAVFRLAFDAKGRLQVETLPSLPVALDNMSGAVAGRLLFVVGGNRAGVPSNGVLCLDLDNLADGWRRLPDFPGEPRLQSVAAATRDAGGGTSLYVWGGFAPSVGDVEASLSVGGYAYSSRSGRWVSVPVPVGQGGDEVSLGGGAAAVLSNRYVVCLGGVDKDIFLNALRSPAPDYLAHPAEWYRFNRRILVYDIRRAEWRQVAESPLAARAGAALVADGENLLLVGGELKPGVRTPTVARFAIRERPAPTP